MPCRLPRRARRQPARHRRARRQRARRRLARRRAARLALSVSSRGAPPAALHVPLPAPARGGSIAALQIHSPQVGLFFTRLPLPPADCPFGGVFPLCNPAPPTDTVSLGPAWPPRPARPALQWHCATLPVRPSQALRRRLSKACPARPRLAGPQPGALALTFALALSQPRTLAAPAFSAAPGAGASALASIPTAPGASVLASIPAAALVRARVPCECCRRRWKGPAMLAAAHKPWILLPC